MSTKSSIRFAAIGMNHQAHCLLATELMLTAEAKTARLGNLC